VRRLAVALAVVAVAVTGCGDDDDIGDAPATSLSTLAPVTTIVSTATTGAEVPATTVAPPESPAPGAPCDLGGAQPDCIDPDGDGEGTYLVGGDECMSDFEDSPGLCSDLDGDGRAGYPDAG
jgi:hypothetical protein